MPTKTSILRIIGGKWRSRKIDFIPLKGLRPTTDMMRETLFNWLAQAIVGANCLDLFAGSGALGFEALSRGASNVVMVDANVKVLSKLKANAKLLQADNAEFCLAKIPAQLKKIPAQSFDVIFLDPPFNQDLVKPTFDELLASGLLAKDAYLYIESEKKLDLETIIPSSWKVIRCKRSGLAKCSLLREEIKI